MFIASVQSFGDYSVRTVANISIGLDVVFNYAGRRFPYRSEPKWLPNSHSLPFPAYATSYWSVIVTLVLSCTVSEILQIFCAPEPIPISPYFW